MTYLAGCPRCSQEYRFDQTHQWRFEQCSLRPQGLIRGFVSDCLGAKRFQFLDNRIGRIASAATINAAAQVVDDDFGSALRVLNRMRSS